VNAMHGICVRAFVHVCMYM